LVVNKIRNSRRQAWCGVESMLLPSVWPGFEFTLDATQVGWVSFDFETFSQYYNNSHLAENHAVYKCQNAKGAILL